MLMVSKTLQMMRKKACFPRVKGDGCQVTLICILNSMTMNMAMCTRDYT